MSSFNGIHHGIRADNLCGVTETGDYGIQSHKDTDTAAKLVTRLLNRLLRAVDALWW